MGFVVANIYFNTTLVKVHLFKTGITATGAAFQYNPC